MLKRKLRVTAAMLMKGTKTTSMKLKGVDKNARNLFVLFFFIILKIHWSWWQFLNIFRSFSKDHWHFNIIWVQLIKSVDFRWNTFAYHRYVTVNIHWSLVMIFACSTIFSRTASNKVNVRGTERNYVNKKLFCHFSVKDLVNFSKNSEDTGLT